MILAPSILAADFTNLGKQVIESEKNGAEWLHIDIMDGHFVPNLSFGPDIPKQLRPLTNQFFDVHLMIDNTEKYIEPFVNAGADGITMHIESTKDMDYCIDKVHSFGKRAAIAINPDTPVQSVMKFIDKIEMVLIMSVFPGYGGQKYIDNVNDKIKFLRKECGAEFDIQVDGGVNRDNIADVYKCGANILVAGTAVFKGDISNNIRELRELCKN